MANLTWTAPANTGGSAITGYRVQVRTGNNLVRTDILAGPATSATVTGLTNGTAYNFRVRAVTAVGLGALSAQSNTVTPATVPGAPVIGTAVTGAAGGGGHRDRQLGSARRERRVGDNGDRRGTAKEDGTRNDRYSRVATRAGRPHAEPSAHLP